MPNYGFTSIIVRGPERARSELQRELAATARGELEFTLVAAAPGVWTGDEHLREATIESTDGILALQVCLPWDQDALRLCGSLASRYPSLRLDGSFHCEGTWPEFTVSSHLNGVEVYHAHFDVRFVADLQDGQNGETGCRLGFYQKSPERDAAAIDFGPSKIAPFLARPPVAGGWRRSDYDAEAGVCFLRGSEGEGVTALVLDLHEGQGNVLSGVDAHGGYLTSQTLGFRDLRELFPELSGEFTTAPVVAPAEFKVAACACGPAEADDMPF